MCPSQFFPKTAQPDKKGIKLTPFCQTLKRKGLNLARGATTTLQINLGLMCNQTCSHCHLNAGPGRKEIMTRKTMDHVLEFAQGGVFETIDVTGGAPEMHPDLGAFIRQVTPLARRIILRSNLTALYEKGEGLMELLRKCRTNIVCSFPSLNEVQAETLRGKGVFHTSLETLRKLNQLGYAREGAGLELDLVVNPAGAFLPPPQAELERRFRRVLLQKWDIAFNNLYSFANVPLGRFRSWLERSGNYDTYMAKLESVFNPCAVDGLMCRSLISVSWDGYLFDCDFNQAAGLFLGNNKMHLSKMRKPPECGSAIAVDNHCYTCTAGAGFT